MAKTEARQTRLILAAFLVSGAAALIYEVTWTRALSLVLGSTTYALSTMLATFMAGLAIGALIGGRWADRSPNPLRLFGLCELGIGLGGLLSVPLIYGLPGLYLSIYRSFHLYPAVFFTLQIVLCALVMLLPTVLMGATFPLVSRQITLRLEQMGDRVGKAYGFNTVGAVLGSLAGGFLLLPALGIRGAAIAAAALNLVIGVGMLLLAGDRAGVRKAAAAVVLFLLVGSWTLMAAEPAGFVGFYTARRYLDPQTSRGIVESDRRSYELLESRQYVEGPLRVYRDREGGNLVLHVGGKIESGGADEESALLAAYLPVAEAANARSGLIIGLGGGVTLKAARNLLPDLTLIEIHSGVLEAVERYGGEGLLEGIRIERNDARNFLFRTDNTFDIISSVPSYPSESVVNNLFTREFFELAARRLSPGGIFCQWLPYHVLTNDDVTMMLRTFGSVFPHARLWKVPAIPDLLLIGSLEPLPRAPEEVLAAVGGFTPEGTPIRFELSRGETEIAGLVNDRSIPLNTDDLPRLEFNVARNLLVGDLRFSESEPEPPSDSPE